DLIDGALVVVHGFHHPFHDRVEELPRFLRIAVGQELHRALEVCQENRDVLALALERVTGGEDAGGEMLRDMRLRRGEDGARLQRPPALIAETAARLIEVPARRTAAL